MDGTFACTPHIFAQVYILHIKVNDEFFPQLWCLLPDKQAVTYGRLFNLLKQEAANQNLQLQPATIHIDYEQAAIVSIRNEFQIEPIGC